MAVLRSKRLRVLRHNLCSRFHTLAVECEGSCRETDLHREDVKQRLYGLDMLIYPEFNANINRFLRFCVLKIERLIDLIDCIEISVQMPCLSVNDRFHGCGWDNYALFAQPKLPDKRIKGNINRFQGV